MDDLTLEPAALTDGDDVLDMLHEIGPGEHGFGNGGYRLSAEEFPAWIRSRIDMEQGINLDPRKVPMTTFWMRKDGHPIGISKLRHRLNDALLQSGGHIGFCIRPSERGKGYARELLDMTIRRAWGMGIDRVLLTCDADNERSWRTIERCGGRLEDIGTSERRYWIERSSACGPARCAHLLSADGKVTRWPKKAAEKNFVLEFMRSKLAAGRRYTEPEVNAVLNEWHLFHDHALLRREMFEHGLLHRTRDGREYWI